ncbi:hypothetical protein [Pleomorphochaeta sp. DL1XJH-081]|uniref:hypothetical protein n=1 Tax=Pleomorphochaeta sp. DL1XJH-081 TaxID=3409690 RepID=UPI003BB66A9E
MMEAGKKRLISILVIMLVYMVGLLIVLSFCEFARPQVQAEPNVAPSPPAIQIATESPTPIFQEVQQPSKEIENPPPEPLVVEEPLPVEEPTENEIEPIVIDAPPPVQPQTQETLLPADEWAEPPVEEDPWADFYVAGEEDYSIFEDGTYYVPLIVNGEYLTDINVTFLQDQLLIDVLEFEAIVSDMLIESFRAQLFSTEETFFTLDYLNGMEIETWYDYQTFELYMNFPTWMMPTRVLSINRGSITRYGSYSMSGSEFLEPEPFSWFTNLSIYSLVDYAAADGWKFNPTSLFTMQSRNSFSVYDIGFDFSYTVHPGRAYNENTIEPWSNDFEDYLTWQGIQGFYDYKPKSLRFLFGNVNDYLGYSTDSIGIAIEKRYAYGDAQPKTHQYEYEVVVDEPSIVEVLINDKSVYRRELQAGIYQLRDFVFTQGANFARVVVEPIAAPERRQDFEFVVGFDSRLLSRGDTLYSASLSFPEKDIGKTIFRLDQQLGLTDEISTSYGLGLSTSAITLGLSNLFATRYGSLDVTLASSYSNPLKWGFKGSLGYRVSGDEDSPFGSLTISTGFTTDRYSTNMDIGVGATKANGHQFDSNLSFSGSIGEKLRYTLGGSLNWSTDETRPAWRITASSGIPLISRMSVSASVSLSATPGAPTPQVRGQVGLNYAFTPNLSISASTNLEDSSFASASWRPFGSTDDNIQFSFTGIQFDDPLDHQGSISYSHSGNAYGLSLRQQYSDGFERFSTSLSLNTAFAYAGGLFGITRSISDNFLLVKPGGALKGSDIAVTRTMTSEPAALPSLFGVGTYTGISTHTTNNVVVYGIGDSLMGSSESFIFDFLPRPRQGYAVRISSEPTFSLVGTLLRSPSAAYSRYTTDLARIMVDEEGNEELQLDETLYLFTDENGFFFISGITTGDYQFSIFLPGSAEDEPPIDVRFSISEEMDPDMPLVLVLENFVASEIAQSLEEEQFAEIMGEEIADPILSEDGYYWLDIVDVMDEITFWDSFFPSRQVLDSVTEVQPSTDAFVEYITPESQQDSALIRMRKEQEQRLFNLARLREIILPYLDAIAPLEGWKP